MSSFREKKDIPSSASAKAKLIQLIEGGEIGYNTPLSERVLAERMGISRTPIREALQDLAREGIVTVQPARGAFINPIGFEEMRDLYEVRLPLEAVAAYRAAVSGDHTVLRDFVGRFEELVGCTPTPDVLRKAQERGDLFHLEMFRAAGNDYLLSLYDRLRLKIKISLRMTREHCPERIMRTVEEHLQVLNAILAHDSEGAQNAIDAHLRNGFQARVEIYSQLPQQRFYNNINPQLPMETRISTAHEEGIKP